MNIVINTKDHLKIRFNPTFIKVFLYVFLLFGIYNFYKLLMGIQVDNFGVFIFITLPTFVLSFLICKTIIEIKDDELIIARYYLMRKKIKSYPLQDIQSFYFRANRGTGVTGTYSFLVQVNGEDVSLISGFASLKKHIDGEAVKELNYRLNKGE